MGAERFDHKGNLAVDWPGPGTAHCQKAIKAALPVPSFGSFPADRSQAS